MQDAYIMTMHELLINMIKMHQLNVTTVKKVKEYMMIYDFIHHTFREAIVVKTLMMKNIKFT